MCVYLWVSAHTRINTQESGKGCFIIPFRWLLDKDWEGCVLSIPSPYGSAASSFCLFSLLSIFGFEEKKCLPPFLPSFLPFF